MKAGDVVGHINIDVETFNIISFKYWDVNSYFNLGHPINNIKITTSLIQASANWYNYSVNLVIDDIVVQTYTTSMCTSAVFESANADGDEPKVKDKINPGTMINYDIPWYK